MRFYNKKIVKDVYEHGSKTVYEQGRNRHINAGSEIPKSASVNGTNKKV